MGKWLARLTLFAYPGEVRRTRGPEMLSMMLDIWAASKLSFARELVSVVLYGFRERAVVAAGVGTRQVVADSCGVAVAILLSLEAWGTAPRIANGAFFTHGSPARGLLIVAMWVALALLLMGYGRAVGAIGVVLLAPIIAIEMLSKGHGFMNEIDPIAQVGVLFACCVVLAATPATRTRRPARVFWLIPIFLLGIAFSAHPVIRSGPPASGLESLSFEDKILLACTLLGLLRMAYDPRLALGCGLLWAMYAVDNAYQVSLGFGQTQWLAVWAAALFLALGTLRLAVMRWRTLS
jgi:hypothetical protein